MGSLDETRNTATVALGIVCAHGGLRLIWLVYVLVPTGSLCTLFKPGGSCSSNISIRSLPPICPTVRTGGSTGRRCEARVE